MRAAVSARRSRLHLLPEGIGGVAQGRLGINIQVAGQFDGGEEEIAQVPPVRLAGIGADGGLGDRAQTGEQRCRRRATPRPSPWRPSPGARPP